MTPNPSPRLRSAVLWTVGAACLAALPAAAQIPASVELLGMGCGSPAPALNSTLPVYTMPLTMFVSNAPPNSPLVLLVTMPPMPPLLELQPGCFLWVDPISPSPHPPFIVFGTTDDHGVFSFTIPLAVMQSLVDEFPPGVVCNAQALILSDAPGAVQLPWFTGFVTNGIAQTMGDPPGMMGGDPGDPRTYVKTEYGSNGAAGQLLMALFTIAFAGGLEVGDYDTTMGSFPPNGKRWTSSGIPSLKTFLMSGGGMSGSFDMDALNTSNDCGGGPLGRHTAALAINVALTDLGVLGFLPGQFEGLMFVDPGSSLHMQTVGDILAAANTALSAGALPAGYSYVTLAQLVEQLNLSFHGGMPSMWAMMHLFFPMP